MNLTLKLVSLAKAFEMVRAVDYVTEEFQVPAIVALVGPNGAGKSTLVNLISGFLTPDSGSIMLGNQNISGLKPFQIVRKSIARTFQELRLLRDLTVLENVMVARPDQRGEKLFYALTRIGIAKEEAANHSVAMGLLGFVGLEEKANELAGELSYGQQKLLSLACCLATEARILLLDEPIAGVHPEMAEHILDLMVKLKEQGKLVVFIEHDLAAVRKIADTVIVMDEGKVIAQGSPLEVLARPEIMEAFVG